MLFIYDEIIFTNTLKKYLNNDGMTTKEIIKTLIKKESYDNFYNQNKIEYDYKITISSIDELKIIMEFFKNHKLLDKEYICIKRLNIGLKETYEIMKEYEKFGFTDKIYVEQLDKHEWINFEDYGIIYEYFKDFDSKLPNNPTNLDIIVNAYDYVKQREYLMEKDKKSLISKQFSTSILSPYIVCAGFVKQFNCILKEYGIPCFEYQFMIDKNTGHDVSLVYIEGMGVYFFDITRDSYDRTKDNLSNEASYSGFMLPYTYYLNNKITNDNFSKELLKNPKILEGKKQYANQQILNGQDKEIDIFDEVEFKKLYLLQSLIDVNFELLKKENFFEKVSYKKEEMTLSVYEALLTMNEKFGPEIDNNTFIDILINSKRNSDLKNNTMFYVKSIISKYSNDSSIDLSKSVDIITKRLTKK